MPLPDRKAQDERDAAALRDYFEHEIRSLREDFAADSAAFRRELMAAQSELDRLRSILALSVVERDPGNMWIQ